MVEGLKVKYILRKVDGRPVDEDGKYFILKLNSHDAAHRKASIAAARTYAKEIKDHNPKLARDLEQLCKQMYLQFCT